MNELTNFNFKGNEFRTIDNNGKIYFCLVDLCNILEISGVTKVKNRLDVDGVTSSKVIDSLGREQEAIFIDEANFYKTVLQSRKPKAEAFTKWVTKDVLPSIRKTGSYSVNPPFRLEKPPVNPIDPNIIKSKIMVARFYFQTCKPNENTKLMLMHSIADPVGLSLPDYTKAKDVLRSASELLKINEVSMNVRQFNQLLLQKGFLTENSRPSTSKNAKDGKSYFKSFTDKGLEYGENQASIHNPKETQPLYYENKFTELLELLNLKQTA